MTSTDEKPKRKRISNKNRRKYFIGWLIISLLFIGVVSLYIYKEQAKPIDIYSPPDGDFWSPACTFQAEHYIYVNSATPYISKTSDNTILKLQDVRPTQAFVGGGYMWKGNTNSTHMIRPDTGNIKIHQEDKRYIYLSNSPSNRYFVKFSNWTDELSDYIIYDGKSQTMVFAGKTFNSEFSWSPDETFALSHDIGDLSSAQLLDMTTQTLSALDLPDDIFEVLGFLDNERLLLLAEDDYLYTWHRLTKQREKFIDIQFPLYYVAEGLEHANNLQHDLPSNGWIGGVDTDSNLHLINVYQPELHHTIPVDGSRSFHFRVRSDYAVIDRYEEHPTPNQHQFFYFDQSQSANFIDTISDTPSKLSPNGKYLAYRPEDTPSAYWIYYIQNGTTLHFEETDIRQYDWVEVEETLYLLYSVPIESGSHIFYLFEPETQNRCKVGTFFSPQINIYS